MTSNALSHSLESSYQAPVNTIAFVYVSYDITILLINRSQESPKEKKENIFF
ncbi:uncharacterized protein SPAPADRAFT_58134 [Spathaspora passalidarum NRRL Y-27907]|uniref:Uncharacterized protein n=1 Tax=Spathaspora passalidarum (strain NRRL Y-27907 / 11-Y1) TaxID=619300 RepID=G3AFL9_SPAPN|nr:uncharacterized protein SPAPADRAFT_58134 [Spathaspora passalidarum NRRL Y-27907]EGW35008.1 hypothetical protein SPAPADRAFT_58134 [Spathaspora passalidarum NRRL Y-27907]